MNEGGHLDAVTIAMAGFWLQPITNLALLINMNDCPFCRIAKERVVFETDTALAFYDGYPISKGHALVIPKRHVTSIFALPEGELAGLWECVADLRRMLEQQFKPDAFNIGVNDGSAAGQTVSHAHIHVIPRYCGDLQDPRGGIRWIMPNKAKYWP